MARFALAVASLLSLASLAVAQDLRINTPSQIYSCQPAAFTYTCPNTPCTIVARPSKDQSSILQNLGDVSDQSGSVSWKPVDVPEGTSVTMWITDANGNTISSAAITVAQGTSTSCLSGGSGASASAGPSSSGSSGSSKTSAAAKGASSSASSAAKGAVTAASQTAAQASSAGASTSGSLSASSGSPSASASAGSNTGNGTGTIAVVKTSSLVVALLGAAAYLA